jgi:DNA ligase D-like protein (predicted 3'-phosphoesterase)
MSDHKQPRFVLHEHFASHHHFDFRLEHEGVLKSWAVPKGLPEKPGERRLAIQVEDHPPDYIGFQGTIPEGQYGAGEVKIWDTGFYEPMTWTDDRIDVFLHGEVFSGTFVIIRFKRAGDKEWLVLRAKDAPVKGT